MFGKGQGLSKRVLAFIACVAGMTLSAYALPGVHIEPKYMAVVVGAVLGLGFLIVKPVLKLLTLPVGCVTMGLFSIVIDVGLIWGLAYVLPGFSLDGVQWAVYCALIIALLRCPVLR